MEAALIERALTPTCERSTLSTLVRDYLENHPHFRGRINDVSINHDGRTLFLAGHLPSFTSSNSFKKPFAMCPACIKFVTKSKL